MKQPYRSGLTSGRFQQSQLRQAVRRHLDYKRDKNGLVQFAWELQTQVQQQLLRMVLRQTAAAYALFVIVMGRLGMFSIRNVLANGSYAARLALYAAVA